MRNKLHYHVVENTPGYLPDSDMPSTYPTKHAAQDAAQELADGYRNDFDNEYIVTGNKRDGYEIDAPEKMYDLGRVIEIIPCADNCEVSE